MKPRYFDRDGNPITLEQWAWLKEAPLFEDYSNVARTTIARHVISTVWLGLDHSYTVDGPPLIFETMVFGPDGEATTCQRYTTEANARFGHDDLCNEVAARMGTN